VLYCCSPANNLFRSRNHRRRRITGEWQSMSSGSLLLVLPSTLSACDPNLSHLLFFAALSSDQSGLRGFRLRARAQSLCQSLASPAPLSHPPIPILVQTHLRPSHPIPSQSPVLPSRPPITCNPQYPLLAHRPSCAIALSRSATIDPRCRPAHERPCRPTNSEAKN